MAIYSPQTVERMRQLRQKDQENLLTQEDMKEVVKLMRAERMTAGTASAKSKVSKGPMRSADQLLDELDSM